MAAQSDPENKSAWELSKENIQPLMSGRKMAYLQRSLETSSLIHSEADISEQIREFEEDIENYTGSDPLEPWIRFINYFEQNCLSYGKFTQQYNSVLVRCVRNFLGLEAQKNDKRFVDIFLKSLSTVQQERRTVLLRNALDSGVGVEIARMHMAVADEYEKAQQFQTAVDALQKGIAANAQPLANLEEALMNLQFRVAEFVSKSIRENNDSSMSSNFRSFGGSIPCAPTNEAPSIRIALSPANPSRSRPRNDMKKIPLFMGENAENDCELPEPSVPLNPIRQIEMIRNEKENEINPTKWNKPHSQIGSEVNVAAVRPADRITLFSDESEFIAPSVSMKTVQRPALSEIRFEEPVEKPEEPQPLPVVEAPTPPAPLPPPILPPVEPAPAPPAPLPPPILPPIESAPQVPQQLPTGNIRIMYRKDQLWENGKEISFEHLRAAEYRRRGVGGLKRNSNSTFTLSREVVTPTGETDSKDQRVQDLEAELKVKSSQIDEFLKEKQTLLDEIARLTVTRGEEIRREVQRARNQCIEEYTADIIKLSREKHEIVTSLRAEKLQRLNLEDENEKLNEEYRKLALHDKLVTNEVERLKELLALQSVPLKPGASDGTKFELFSDPSFLPLDVGDENALPRLTAYDEQNKENVRASNSAERIEEKPKRTMVGVLMPSISAEPQALVFEEDAMEYCMEPDDTEVVLKKNETAVDFNLSNLTRALNFNPRPLENSTPERRSNELSDFQNDQYYLPLGVTPFSFGGANGGQPGSYQMSYQRSNFNQTLQNAQNLSTIQETSKENRSCCTTSSSSSNRTTASTFSCTSNFTRSASKHQLSHHHQ